MKEWKGPMEDIRRACERWGIDTDFDPGDATSCPACLYRDVPSYKEPCRSCAHNICVSSNFEPWRPTFGEWVPADKCLPDTDEVVLVSCRTKKGVGSVNRAYYSDGYWHGSGSMSGVVAWMPLPKLYDGGGYDD